MSDLMERAVAALERIADALEMPDIPDEDDTPAGPERPAYFGAEEDD